MLCRVGTASSSVQGTHFGSTFALVALICGCRVAGDWLWLLLPNGAPWLRSCPPAPDSRLPLSTSLGTQGRGSHWRTHRKLEAETATRPRQDPCAGETAGGGGLPRRPGEPILSEGEGLLHNGAEEEYVWNAGDPLEHLGFLCPVIKINRKITAIGPDPPGMKARVLPRGKEPRSADRADGEIMGWGGGRCLRHGWDPMARCSARPAAVVRAPTLPARTPRV